MRDTLAMLRELNVVEQRYRAVLEVLDGIPVTEGRLVIRGGPADYAPVGALDQASALLEAAEASRLHAFIVLCLLAGVRSEEVRALTWEHVDLEAGTISVWRSVRAHGDTKTNRSRRTLKLPEIAVEALPGQRERQARGTGCRRGVAAGARAGIHHVGFTGLGGLVVSGADDQVSGTGLGAFGDRYRRSGLDEAEGDEVVADAAVEFAAQRVAGGHEEGVRWCGLGVAL